ncbi:hypothetical protein M2272_004149 [Mycobacterium frederiksbergense]|uniref:Secreted protein n=1 Tax=Mycolicibacterium frederiksbergense TaxID=117567 RepID=A0ABT6L3J8_9MYCO|nr:hypothetical protein [Mycolicibacterium frederiksbergense]MDH6197494.1 hypothetical protein [Mycolicibacterium frederiksbergense]
MSVTQKLIGFVVGLAVVFGVAFGLGAAWGPVTALENGYTLELADSTLPSGKQAGLRFRITDDSGVPVTSYVESHQKLLHLIVVRRDLTGYQHVHPSLDGTGTWSVPLDLSSAGDYRVFADFVPTGGNGLTLGADLRVAGDYRPRPLPAAANTATVDGHTVTLAGSPKAGEPSELTLSVSRAGRPVTDLQPYLGAYGHLVALRAADLAYLHVHPMGEPGDPDTPAGPDIGFHTSFPSAGDYRLFLDFKHGDVVRTAEFTVSVPAGGPRQEQSSEHDHQGEH